jgi:hypothetical protein
MKKAIILFVFILVLTSIRCEKEAIYLEDEDDCWICVDQYNTASPPIETLIICDPVEAALQNTRKHYKDKWGKWHNWVCTPL